MNDNETKEVLRELRRIRACAVISTVVFVLALLAYVLRIRFF
jgi:hypothetical protein